MWTSPGRKSHFQQGSIRYQVINIISRWSKTFRGQDFAPGSICVWICAPYGWYLWQCTIFITSANKWLYHSCCDVMKFAACHTYSECLVLSCSHQPCLVRLNWTLQCVLTECSSPGFVWMWEPSKPSLVDYGLKKKSFPILVTCALLLSLPRAGPRIYYYCYCEFTFAN